MFAMIAIALQGWILGDPRLLMNGWDSDSNGCGYSDKTRDFPLLYWPLYLDSDLIGKLSTADLQLFLNKGICVKFCPTDD